MSPRTMYESAVQFSFPDVLKTVHSATMMLHMIPERAFPWKLLTLAPVLISEVRPEDTFSLTNLKYKVAGGQTEDCPEEHEVLHW